jgi:hypothetical protein
MTSLRFRRAAALLGLHVLASGCAGATLGSGVGDTWLDRPPYYGGSAVAAGPELIGHLPITYQRGASHPTIFDPADGSGTAIGALLADMNAYLDELGATEPLPSPGSRGIPPDVYFGCDLDGHGRCGENVQVGRGGHYRMRLAVGRPSRGWITATQAALDSAGLGRTLVITLEVGQYWPQQKNWRGDKEVLLGTDHAAAVPWLTALDAPVSVLQLTGALIDREGRAVRIGAEGLLARRTHVVLTGLGVQSLISDGDVEALRSRRREDLPGQPLVWEAALRTLVAELSGQRGLAP